MLVAYPHTSFISSSSSRGFLLFKNGRRITNKVSVFQSWTWPRIVVARCNWSQSWGSTADFGMASLAGILTHETASSFHLFSKQP